MKRTHAKKPKPQNQVTAIDLLRRLATIRKITGEIAVRGGILAVLDDAQVKESSRRAVVAGLDVSWKALRSYVATIGDDRRAKGQAAPLCWIPGED